MIMIPGDQKERKARRMGSRRLSWSMEAVGVLADVTKR